MKPSGVGKTRLIAKVPARGLIGYHGEFLTDTRGTGIMNRVFSGWSPYKGSIEGRRAGVLISIEDGDTVRMPFGTLRSVGKCSLAPKLRSTREWLSESILVTTT